ncbi:MAG: glutamate-5-semialdehyde dehydrogenase, partial [Solirubrobacteraceae bacterium]|nr:glutamate-5-semialdehyde dehydrogenase [Solirubrobacteraceae bacterium]
MTMATAVASVAEICSAAKRASRALARLDGTLKDVALEAIATSLEQRLEEILAANERDMQLGAEAEIGDALLDRLRLDEARVASIAGAVRQIAALGDPVGEVIEGRRLANGLDVRKVR